LKEIYHLSESFTSNSGADIGDDDVVELPQQSELAEVRALTADDIAAQSYARNSMLLFTLIFCMSKGTRSLMLCCR
jgi:hypothetical protein